MLESDHKVSLKDLQEGDTVTMGLNAHNFEESGACLTGEIVEMPRDSDVEWLYSEDKPGRPMADLTVEGVETGTRWTWHIDNGYVTGPVDAEDRPERSDIGHIGGLYDPEARDEFYRRHDAGLED